MEQYLSNNNNNNNSSPPQRVGNADLQERPCKQLDCKAERVCQSEVEVRKTSPVAAADNKKSD